jgi:hypothetical protein
MKIADRTPFRNAGGQIDIFGRMQATLKFGLGWYARIQAQDIAIAVLEKILDQNFILLRNVTLPDTDIELPLVLIGTPGVYLINVTHERGVYRARDDEWGTISGEKFVPARVNQVQRTVKLGRVLQIYLDRAGYKGALIIEPILMSADPGMHIESVRPVARIVMSDALERFAISLNQAKPVFNPGKITEIAQVILKGPKKQAQAKPDAGATDATLVNEKQAAAQTLISTPPLINTPDSAAQPPNANPAYSADTLNFSFDEKKQDQQAPFIPAAQSQATLSSQSAASERSDDSYGSLWDTSSQIFEESEPDAQAKSFSNPTFAALQELPANAERALPEAQPKTDGKSSPASSAPRKTVLLGMTKIQIIILGGILLFWLCAMAGFAIFIYFNL